MKKIKIYFKRKISSRSAVIAVMKDLDIIGLNEVKRDEETGLVTLVVHTNESIEYIEQNANVAFSKEV